MVAAASAPVYLVPMYSELCDSRASAAGRGGPSLQGDLELTGVHVKG